MVKQIAFISKLIKKNTLKLMILKPSITEDKRRLRDCVAQFAEEEMKQCFFLIFGDGGCKNEG